MKLFLQWIVHFYEFLSHDKLGTFYFLVLLCRRFSLHKSTKSIFICNKVILMENVYYNDSSLNFFCMR